MTANISFETPSAGIRVARFLRPDLRSVLYDHGSIADSTLYKELRAGAIDPLQKDETLILNFGLVDWFPTVFFSLMLRALEEVRAKGGRVVVCCLPPNVKEGFGLMGGERLFAVHPTEARAVAESKH